MQSWIGWHTQPCASDTHDAVVVMGTLNQDPSSGDTYPVANLATPKAITDGIESGEGESKPSSEKASPKVMTSPTSQFVENASSGDAHPIASEISIKPKVEACIEEIIDIAQADNGALLQGDSPNSTRFEATEDLMAARDLLLTLYSCMGGSAPRAEEEVLRATTTICQRHCCNLCRFII